MGMTLAPSASSTTSGIRISEFAEPLSVASLEGGKESLSIESDAMRVLVGELKRYCGQEISGRSVLISGHRGAGKTTMVQHAFRRVLQEADQGKVLLRPLYVQLHGPSLFPDFANGQNPAETPAGLSPTVARVISAKAKAAAAARGERNGNGGPIPGEDASADGKKRPDDDLSVSARDARLALEQITLSLHRAVAREFCVRVWRHALERSGGAPDTAGTSPTNVMRRPRIERRRVAEMMEVAATFEHELHDCPGPMRLRDFWTRLNVLQQGVLRPPKVVFPTSRTAASSQGMRELVALSGVCEAYRRISGQFEKSDSDVDEVNRKLEAALAADTAGTRTVPAIASLLTGGLVGGGLALAHGTALSATAGGLVAALGSSLVFRWSSSHASSRAIRREYKFLFDTSIATLDRVLPVLLERLLDAGLAPIFVVDELDKVDDLSDRIFGMVRHLKKLVAENAFFCFLTDRSYFEEMRRRGERRAYPLEYSYFTHRLFVSYRADDFHVYLGKLFGEPPPSGPGTPTAGSTPVSGSAGTPVPVEYPVLRYLLLHRSEMHALELHRLLTTFRSDTGAIALTPEELRSSTMFRVDIALQLGLEIILEDDDLQDRIRGEPEFQRLAHDALLYPTREWRDGALEIDLGADTIPAFREYLVGRMNRSEATGSVDPRLKRGKDKSVEKKNATSDIISDKDVEILWDKVGDLVKLLSRPAELDRRFKEWNVRREKSLRAAVDLAVLDRLELSKNHLPFRRIDPVGSKYAWRYDQYGVDQFPPAPAIVLAPQPAPAPVSDPTADDIELIKAFAAGLESVKP
jgi:hypothetical protein